MLALLRTIVFLVVVVVLVAAATAFFLGYRIVDGHHALVPGAAGTSGSGQVQPVQPLDQQQQDRGTFDTEKARERGALIGEKLAEAGNKAAAFISDAALTAKVKSKMELDDHVKAADIHVSTTAHVVTLSGTARTADERQRAVALARDTEGVKEVIDHVRVSGR